MLTVATCNAAGAQQSTVAMGCHNLIQAGTAVNPTACHF
jgi:hypothetical protein